MRQVNAEASYSFMNGYLLHKIFDCFVILSGFSLEYSPNNFGHFNNLFPLIFFVIL